ncbi:hypothetical protein ZWY2020_043654 [Hordeum vulgare]|nr:hypothetical protein ZWY2020_043654 [Hordeum vulgare]
METKALILITVSMAMIGTAFGTSHTVGAPGGSWDLHTNYSQWASRIRFTTGDELQFLYPATVQVDVKSKVVRTVQRCRGTGNRRRCQSKIVSSSAAAGCIGHSTVARFSVAAVVIGLMLFF